MQTRKICLLGDFGVGKTSTVARYIHQSFSEKYLTTVGVKVDSKTVNMESGDLKLVIWDIAGTDTATPTYRSYLRGAQGYLLVVDGTRAYTLDNAINLREQIADQLGSIPFIGLVNKSDLTDQQEIPEERLEILRADGQTWLHSSALTGENVETAFQMLADQLVAQT